MFELLPMDLQAPCEGVIQEPLQAEWRRFLNRQPYQRSTQPVEERNYRNGSSSRR